MDTQLHEHGSLKGAAFEVGLDFAVKTAPLLAKSVPLRHAVLQTGKLISSRIRPANPLLSTLPLGVLTDQALFGDVFIKTFDRVLSRRLSEATLRNIVHNLIHGALVQGGNNQRSPTFRSSLE